jgi:hypothetical protein
MIKAESGNIIKLIGFLIVIIGVFFIVWMRSSIKSLEYRLAKYQAVQTELIKKQRNLYAIKDNELSIQNVDKVVKELGFDIPDRSKVYYVKSQKVSSLGKTDRSSETQ